MLLGFPPALLLPPPTPLPLLLLSDVLDDVESEEELSVDVLSVELSDVLSVELSVLRWTVLSAGALLVSTTSEAARVNS